MKRTQQHTAAPAFEDLTHAATNIVLTAAKYVSDAKEYNMEKQLTKIWDKLEDILIQMESIQDSERDEKIQEAKTRLEMAMDCIQDALYHKAQNTIQ